MQSVQQSSDLEKTVLGACLASEARLHEFLPFLSEEDFTLDSHKTIWRTMSEMATAGKSVDLLTISDTMAGTNKLQSIGGVTYLADLSSGAVMVSSERYVELLSEKTRRRKLTNSLRVGLERSEAPDSTTDEIVGDLTTALVQVLADSNKPQAQAMNLLIEETLKQINEQRQHKNLAGLPTGLWNLDTNLGGYRQGEMVVIGGRPGQGKSSLALQSAEACAQDGHPALIFSLEMSRHELFKRTIARMTQTDFGLIHNPRRLKDEEFSMMALKIIRYADWPLYVDDSPTLQISELVARARLMVKRFGIKAVFVDYIQLVQAKGRDERERLNLVSEGLRQLAKSENVAVISLSQLARPKDGNENERPTMYRLKESGKIEQDAHTILLLYRPVAHTDDPNIGVRSGEFTGEDEIIIAKQRNGPTGHEKLTFIGETMSFKPRTTEITQ